MTTFAALKARPGVLLAYDGTELGKRYAGSPLRGYPLEPFGWQANASGRGPVLDSAVPLWGASSIRFDRPTQTGADAAGYVYYRFPRQFGEGDTLCTITGVMWNDAQCNARFTELARDAAGNLIPGTKPQGGFKLWDIGTGYQPKPSVAFLNYYPSGDPRTSNRTKIVKQTYYRSNAPEVYVGEVGSEFSTPNQGVREVVRDGTSTPDYLLQNSLRTSSYKSFLKQGAWNPKPDGFFCNLPGVFTLYKETLEIGQRVGKLRNAWDVHYRFWAWRAGESPVQLIDWQPGVPGYFPFPAGDPLADEKYGTAFQFPYGTGMDPLFDHLLAQVWYSGFILADRDIDLNTPQPSTGVMTVATQAELDQAVADCKTAYNSASIAAGTPTMDEQIASATSAAAAAQLATDQQAITDANAARDAAVAKKAQLDADIDAAQTKDA